MAETELPAHVRQLIETASAAPVEADRAAIRARIAATVAGEGGGSGGAGRAGRWLLGGALTAVLITGGYLALHHGGGENASPLTPQPAPVVIAQPSPPQEPAPTIAPAEPAPVAVPAPAPPPAVHITHTSPHPAPSAATPGDESALLAEAARALARGENERVVMLTIQHTKQFPHGALAEERDSLLIEALLALGHRDAAAAAAKRFMSTYPHSVHAAQIQRALHEEAPR